MATKKTTAKPAVKQTETIENTAVATQKTNLGN
jgi:hypothetical protein